MTDVFHFISKCGNKQIIHIFGIKMWPDIGGNKENNNLILYQY